MWSNVISIDKSYDREIDYVLSRVQKAKNFSYAIEESLDRIWIHVAGACENKAAAEEDMTRIASTVFLSYFKLRFFLEALNVRRLSFSKCALLSALINFDRDFEESIVRRTLSDTLDLNLDGIMNFRLRALKESWAELAEMAGRLTDGSVEESEMFDVAAFITGSDGGQNQLALTRSSLKNVTRRKIIDVIDLYDEDEYNLLCAIISEKPCEIVIDGRTISKPLRATLKRLARVIEK